MGVNINYENKQNYKRKEIQVDRDLLLNGMKYKVSFELDLKRNPYKGKYIVIEGIDGCGKTTQAEKITKYFEKQKKKVWNIHEPTRTDAIGSIIHDFLNKKIVLPPQAVQYLYTADRIYQQENLTVPLLKKGNIIISQRCFWSSVPYGMMDRFSGKFNFKEKDNLLVALSILSMYYQVLAPNITIYLRTSAKVAHNRLSKVGIEEHYDKFNKLLGIEKGYEWMVKTFPKEFIIINGEQSEEEVTREIIEKINNIS